MTMRRMINPLGGIEERSVTVTYLFYGASKRRIRDARGSRAKLPLASCEEHSNKNRLNQKSPSIDSAYHGSVGSKHLKEPLPIALFRRSVNRGTCECPDEEFGPLSGRR
jgi:hypothetical protein